MFLSQSPCFLKPSITQYANNVIKYPIPPTKPSLIPHFINSSSPAFVDTLIMGGTYGFAFRRNSFPGFKNGADLVGFAPVERFDTGPEKTRPDYYLPRAKSVVPLAIAYPRSIGQAWGTYAEKGALPGPYMWFGFDLRFPYPGPIPLATNKNRPISAQII